MKPQRPDSDVRRLLLGGMVVAGLAAAGCSSAPPAPAAAPAPSRRERIAAALKALSFKEEDDGWYLSLPAPLLFEFDRDAVNASAQESLGKIARELRELDIKRVMVRGHTDNVGGADYNLALSKRRADAVARVLADGSFPAERIDARGQGATVPIADNASAEGRAQNRRVVIIVQVD